MVLYKQIMRVACYGGGMDTIPVSDARAGLPDLIDRLPETGPVALTRYSDVVAELHPPGALDATFADHLTLIDRLTAWTEQGPAASAADLRAVGIDTAAEWRDFIDAVDALRDASGVKLSTWNLERTFPEDVTMAERVARMVFEQVEADAIDAAGQDILEWLQAALDIRALSGRGATPMCIWGFDEDSPMLPELIAAGHTPATFRAKASELIGSGVAPEDLHAAMAPDALAPDLIAADPHSPDRLGRLTGAGVSDTDAVTILRMLQQGITSPWDKTYRAAFDDAVTLASAGIVDGADLIAAITQKRWNAALVRRALADGITDPADWQPLLARIGNRKYGQEGELPLWVLADAADRGLSLLRWDNNSHLQQGSGRRRITLGLGDFPWSVIYHDRVIDLAAAGVSPGLAWEAAGAMTRRVVNGPGPTGAWPGHDFADDVIGLAKAGLTLDLARELHQAAEAVRAPFSPDDIHGLLSLGLTATWARHLRDAVPATGAWADRLRQQADRQEAATTYVTALTGRAEEWQVVTGLATPEQRAASKARSWSRPGALYWEALDLLGTPERLTHLHLLQLASVLDSSAYPGPASAADVAKRVAAGIADFHRNLRRAEQVRRAEQERSAEAAPLLRVVDATE